MALKMIPPEHLTRWPVGAGGQSSVTPATAAVGSAAGARSPRPESGPLRPDVKRIGDGEQVAQAAFVHGGDLGVVPALAEPLQAQHEVFADRAEGAGGRKSTRLN